MNGIDKHICDTLATHVTKCPENYFVVCAQGSMNYPGLFDKTSDVDSKCLCVPQFKDIVMNKAPMNHVVVLENEDHCDIKDVREYFRIMKKQNVNFIEILFTDYWIANEMYLDKWLELREIAEDIARLNTYRTMKACKGMAMEKWKALTHRYPTRAFYIDNYGYDGKQLSHIIRLYDFMTKYAENISYLECLKPEDPEFILAIKRHTANLDLPEAKRLAEDYMTKICTLENEFNNFRQDVEDPETSNKMNQILYDIIKRSVKRELI